MPSDGSVSGTRRKNIGEAWEFGKSEAFLRTYWRLLNLGLKKMAGIGAAGVIDGWTPRTWFRPKNPKSFANRFIAAVVVRAPEALIKKEHQPGKNWWCRKNAPLDRL